MSCALPEQIFTPWFHMPNIRAANRHSPAGAPPEFTVPHPTTGTEDDDDEPEDEHPGENEASEREADDSTEAPEEFETDDEDGRTPR
jgi:hypothetical protein